MDGRETEAQLPRSTKLRCGPHAKRPTEFAACAANGRTPTAASGLRPAAKPGPTPRTQANPSLRRRNDFRSAAVYSMTRRLSVDAIRK